MAHKPKSGPQKEPAYTVTLPLRTALRDESRLNDRMEVGKRLSNVCLRDGIRLVEAMRACPEWSLARAMPRTTEAQRVARGEAFAALRKKHGFTQNGFETSLIAHKNRAGFKGRIGAHETQKIAGRAFAAVNRWLLGLGGKPRFKGRLRPLHSLEGKNNSGMLQWKPGTKCVQMESGWTIPAVLPDMGKDEWLWQALRGEVKYCRVLWRRHRGRKVWVVQLVMGGRMPIKASLLARIAAKDTEGGLDFGPSRIAWVTDTEGGEFAFCAEVERPHQELTRLQRHLDRQRRASNPQNYTGDGTVRKGKKTWAASNRQKASEIRLQEAYRHEAAVRENAHGAETNFLLSKAVAWRDDGVSPKALQKRYGKSVSVRGPGHFMSELTRKAERAGGGREIIDVRNLKNSQYDHTTNDFAKKPLSERWHVFRGGKGAVQRDVYSAFLARNSRGNVYELPGLEQAWARLAPALAVSGLYKEHKSRAKDASPERLPTRQQVGAVRR